MLLLFGFSSIQCKIAIEIVGKCSVDFLNLGDRPSMTKTFSSMIGDSETNDVDLKVTSLSFFSMTPSKMQNCSLMVPAHRKRRQYSEATLSSMWMLRLSWHDKIHLAMRSSGNINRQQCIGNALKIVSDFILREQRCSNLSQTDVVRLKGCAIIG